MRLEVTALLNRLMADTMTLYIRLGFKCPICVGRDRYIRPDHAHRM